MDVFYIHLGKNIDKATSFASYFFLTYKVLSCKLRVPRRPILKNFNKFSNFSLVTPLLDVDLEDLEKDS